MKNRRRHNGYALAGTMMFLLIVMIIWLSVTRQIGTYLRVEKHFQLQKSYYRTLYWGLELLKTGLPPYGGYSCRVQVGEEGRPQTFVITFNEISALNYRIVARPADSGDSLLPEAPPTFAP
jgi:hypothetical protein